MKVGTEGSKLLTNDICLINGNVCLNGKQLAISFYTSTGTVRIGCTFITHEAFEKIVQMVSSRPIAKVIVLQEGLP